MVKLVKYHEAAYPEEGGGDKGKNSFQRIYDVVRQIPRGKVATYGQVARLAGNPRWARVVGFALHVNNDPEHVPCYRVVTKDGAVSKAFAFGGENEQIRLLNQAAEGGRGGVSGWPRGDGKVPVGDAVVSVNKMRRFTLISGCRHCDAYKSHAPFRCFRSLQGANRKFAFSRR